MEKAFAFELPDLELAREAKRPRGLPPGQIAVAALGRMWRNATLPGLGEHRSKRYTSATRAQVFAGFHRGCINAGAESSSQFHRPCIGLARVSIRDVSEDAVRGNFILIGVSSWLHRPWSMVQS
jgi:hypothetical protein